MNEPSYLVVDLSNPEIPVNRGAPCFTYEEAQQLLFNTDPERIDACKIYRLCQSSELKSPGQTLGLSSCQRRRDRSINRRIGSLYSEAVSAGPSVPAQKSAPGKFDSVST